MDDLITQLYKARQEQAKCKEHLQACQLEYSVTRAESYLRHAAAGHYKAQNMTTSDKQVIAALSALNAAKMSHYRAWIESSCIQAKLGYVTHDLDDTFVAQDEHADVTG